jgi:hypothetical protein
MKENKMQNNWQEEWLDMPEFVQEKQEPYAKIIIRFDNEKDLNDFSKLINQPLNKKNQKHLVSKIN